MDDAQSHSFSCGDEWVRESPVSQPSVFCSLVRIHVHGVMFNTESSECSDIWKQSRCIDSFACAVLEWDSLASPPWTSGWLQEHLPQLILVGHPFAKGFQPCESVKASYIPPRLKERHCRVSCPPQTCIQCLCITLFWVYRVSRKPWCRLPVVLYCSPVLLRLCRSVVLISWKYPQGKLWCLHWVSLEVFPPGKWDGRGSHSLFLSWWELVNWSPGTVACVGWGLILGSVSSSSGPEKAYFCTPQHCGTIWPWLHL